MCWEPLWDPQPMRGCLCILGLGGLNTPGPVLRAGDDGRALGMRRCLAGHSPMAPLWGHLASAVVGDQGGSAGHGREQPGSAGPRRAVGAGWGLTVPSSPCVGDNVTTGGLGAAELAEDLLLRTERSPPGTSKGKKGTQKHPRGSRGRNCHIRNLMVKVRDLGLGFNSDEIVLFKYCSGSCHRARSNYDLTLGSLLRQQLITPGPQERVLSHPCCRPTRYEAVSFMDVQNTWQTVEKLSAAECSCIG